MKSLFTFCTLLFLILTSCKVSEKPKFITVNNIVIENISSEEVTFKANAVFENKNDIGGQLFTEKIEVFADNMWIGEINADEFNVPAKDTFKIPLQGHFSTSKLLNQKTGDLLNNVLTIFKSQKIAVSFRGDIVFKKGLFKYKYHVDKTNNVRFKL